MREWILNNIGTIGGIVGILLLIVLLMTTEYWMKTKWDEPIGVMLGLFACVGAFNTFEAMFKWLAK
jgi:hypothetical protein